MPSKTEFKQWRQAAAAICREAKCSFDDLVEDDQSFVRAHAATVDGFPNKADIRRVAILLGKRLAFAKENDVNVVLDCSAPAAEQAIGGGQARRIIAMQRFNKLRQDTEWQHQLKEACKAEESDRAARHAVACKKTEEQRRILEKQIAERQELRRAQAEEAKTNRLAVTALAEKEAAEERYNRVRKMNVLTEERSQREQIRVQLLAIRKRETEYQQQLEAEEVAAADEAKRQCKQDEMERKQQQASLARALARDNEQRTRYRLSQHAAQREAERTLMKQPSVDKSRREVTAVLDQQSVRSKAGDAKRAAVVPLFEQAHDRQLVADKKKEEAIRKVVENDLQKLKDEKEKMIHGTVKNREELAAALRVQIGEKRTGRSGLDSNDTSLVDRRVGLAMLADQQQRHQEEMRKKELLDVLSAQIKDKDIRSRMPLQVKI